MPSGADLQQQRLLAAAGVPNPTLADGAFLEQQADLSNILNSGLPLKTWQSGNVVPTETDNFRWLIILNVGDPLPVWTPVGSLIVRK